MKKKYKVRKREGCRICSGDCKLIHKIENAPFTDEFLTNGLDAFTYDIDIYSCNDCGTIQTLHDVNVISYYDDYQYTVGNSTTAQKFMNEISRRIKLEYFETSNNPKVLEIGSGDGEQLKFFKDNGFSVYGIEPSKPLCQISKSKGIDCCHSFFDKDSSNRAIDYLGNPDLIFMSYTFDHIPDPVPTLNLSRDLLRKNGLLVFEVHNIRDILIRGEYCLLEHEHSIYLDEYYAAKLLESCGFKIINLDIVPHHIRRANSLIVVATLAENSNYQEISSHELNSISLDYRNDLGMKINQTIDNLDKYVFSHFHDGKRIIAYGAGGRGVMTLAAMKSAVCFKAIYDMSPKSIGTFVPKTNIPLLDASMISQKDADLVIVFSFGYIDEISAYLLEKGFSDNQIVNLLELLET